MANTIFDVEGIVYRIDQPYVHSDFFKKQSFILLIKSTYQDKNYEDFVEMDCINAQMEQLRYASVGNKVKVGFVLQGRESKKLPGRYFNTLKVISIKVLEATTLDQRAQNTAVDSQQRAVDDFVGAENNSLNPSDGPDDLPF